MKKLIFFLSFAVFVIDQIIKYWIRIGFSLSETFYFIPNFFYLTYVKNTGGAWSVFQSIPNFLIFINILFLIGIIQYIFRKKFFSFIEVIYLGLIIGGLFGNFIDRIFVGGVIDYIGLQFGNYYYPIFNFADIMIVLGVFLIIVEIIRGEIDEYRSRNQGN